LALCFSRPGEIDRAQGCLVLGVCGLGLSDCIRNGRVGSLIQVGEMSQFVVELALEVLILGLLCKELLLKGLEVSPLDHEVVDAGAPAGYDIFDKRGNDHGLLHGRSVYH